jgi:tetratricopeptide (TPR) repeat protein
MAIAVLLGADGGLADASPIAPPTTKVLTDTAGLVDAIDGAVAKANERDAKAVQSMLTEVVAAPAFSALSESQRHFTWALLAAADTDLGSSSAALIHARKATEFPSATTEDWHLRLAAAYAVDDHADSILSLETIAERWPTSLDQENEFVVASIANSARKGQDAPDHGYRLLRDLFSAGWKSSRDSESPDGWWRDLALLELEHGDLDRAVEVARRIEAVDELIALHADRRFDPVVARDPARFEPARGAAVSLADARDNSAAQPNKLAAINRVAKLLMRQARDQEALKLLDEALAKALPADGSASAFIDADEMIWTMDYRMNVLQRLGRFDEAVEQGRKAARRPEHGGVNVSQTINLGDLLYNLGRAKEARETVAEIARRDVSGYGALAADEVRVCAAAQLGDAKTVSNLLQEMTKHADDGAPPYANALLCAGEFDSLAAFYIKRLADPQTRIETLEFLQSYELDRAVAPYGKVLEARQAALLQRPDLKSAIDKVGRSMSWQFVSPQT